MTWVSVGHNHRNDFYGTLSGITLGYGRKSGFASITDKDLKIGARVFEVSNDGSIRTWVREQDGGVVEYRVAKRRREDEPPQMICCRAKL